MLMTYQEWCFPAKDPIPQVRQMTISRDMIARFGYIPGCRKCEALSVGNMSRPTLGHSAECRVRVGSLVAGDSEFQRLGGARARQEEFLARQVELGDEEAQRQKKARQEEPEPNVELQ